MKNIEARTILVFLSIVPILFLYISARTLRRPATAPASKDKQKNATHDDASLLINIIKQAKRHTLSAIMPDCSNR